MYRMVAMFGRGVPLRPPLTTAHNFHPLSYGDYPFSNRPSVLGGPGASLTNLAKYPASTVQILGAEKALFRALKNKTNTPAPAPALCLRGWSSSLSMYCLRAFPQAFFPPRGQSFIVVGPASEMGQIPRSLFKLKNQHPTQSSIQHSGGFESASVQSSTSQTSFHSFEMRMEWHFPSTLPLALCSLASPPLI